MRNLPATSLPNRETVPGAWCGLCAQVMPAVEVIWGDSSVGRCVVCGLAVDGVLRVAESERAELGLEVGGVDSDDTDSVSIGGCGCGAGVGDGAGGCDPGTCGVAVGARLS